MDNGKGKGKGAKKRGRPPTVPIPNPKKKGKSDVWLHFTKEDNPPRATEDDDEEPEQSGVPKCICNYCGSDFHCDSKKHGTSHLWSHLRKVCELSPLKNEDEKQKILSFEPLKGGKEGDGQLVAVAYNKEACRTALTQYIVLDKLPF
ncbi:hypothetical protein CsatB_026989 [Cannabis sativa]